METKFGTFNVQANKDGSKYPSRVQAVVDGKIVRIMLNAEQAKIHKTTITGVLTFGEEINERGKYGYRLVSIDNERAFTLECLGLQAKAAKYSGPISELVGTRS